MHRHISKGGWAFSDRDQGWQVSDCSAEALKVINQSSKQNYLAAVSKEVFCLS